jgi:hypothetical protein
MAMGRRAMETSMRAVPGTYRNCSAASPVQTVQFSSVVFAEAIELVEFALDYEQIMCCFELEIVADSRFVIASVRTRDE